MKRKRIVVILLIVILTGVGVTSYVIQSNRKTELEQALRSEKPMELESALKSSDMSTSEKHRYIGRFQETLAFEKAELLLDSKTSQNQMNWFYAAQFAPRDTVATWLKKGAKVNQLNQKKQSVLHVATSVNRSSDAYALLVKRATSKDLNRIDAYGHTPLFYATLDQNETVIELLLGAGANPNLGKERPIYETVKQNRKDLFELLKQHKAKVETKQVKKIAKMYRATTF